MVGDLSLLAAVASAASPVVYPPSNSKDLYGVLPFQGKRTQDPSATVAALQVSALPQHPHHHLEGMPQALQMVVPGHQGPAAAYQAFAFPDKAALVDVQDTDPDSVRLSLGIAEQCAREEKVVKLLTSLPNMKDLDASLIAEVTGQQTLAINLGTQPYIVPDDKLSICEFGPYIPDDKLSICEFGLDEPLQQYLLEKQLVIPDPLINFARSFGSALTIDQNGRVLFVGSGDEVRNLLVLLGLNMSRREATMCKAAMLVPYFDRKRLARANSHASNSKLASTVAGTLKSADAKSKSSSKKKQKSKHIKERDLYQKNYVHASEAFLSILLLDKDKSSSTILSLKKAGPEITELLTQCSIGIAGTGLAVLLSVMCKMATGMRAPYASSRLLSTSVGFGLFWLSWAVNGLRDTIASISRNPGNMNLEEEEVVVRIQKNTNEILFRAVTLLAITALKFA